MSNCNNQQWWQDVLEYCSTYHLLLHIHHSHSTVTSFCVREAKAVPAYMHGILDKADQVNT